jgi:signal transduction histidine kinase
MRRAYASAQGRPPARTLVLSLALYRYFAFMVGVALTLAWPTVRGERVGVDVYVALALVAGFILLGILLGAGIHLQPKNPLSYAYLALDSGISLAAVLLTGGLESGFLLYSLASVLAASFFMTRPVSLAVTGLLAGVLLAVHIAGALYIGLLTGNMLSIFLLYTIAACLVALIPYLANLNLRQQLEDTVATAERLRMRRELHDTLAQDIGFLNMRAAQIRDSLSQADSVAGVAKTVTEVASLQEALEKTYQDVRDYLDMLTVLATLDLLEGLRELGRDTVRRTNIQVDQAFPKGQVQLPPHVEAHILAVAREALTNIEKHAAASRARMALHVDAGAVHLIVEDDGRGFDAAAPTPPGHYGLTGMRERAEGLGGAFAVRSAPGQGTSVEVRIPL